MRLFDFQANVVKSLPKRKINQISILLGLDEDGLANVTKYCAVIDEAIDAAIEQACENTYFEFDINKELNLDKEEVWHLFLLIGARLSYKLCSDALRFEEERLHVESDNVALSYMAFKRLRNFKSKINCFSFCVVSGKTRVEMVCGG